jgi:outer membrane protein TolC
MPQITAAAGAQTNKRPTASRTTTKSASKNYSTDASATINWDFIDLTRQPGINSAEESLRRQKLLFNVSARNLILAIQQSYFSIQSSAQLIESFKQIYAINKQQLSILSERRNIQMTTILDVEQTKSQLFAQLNELVNYTQRYITQTAQLAKNLALKPGQLAIPAEKAIPQGVWTQSLSQTILEGLEQREEILANIAASEAAEWTGIAALRRYLPVFSFQATGNLNNLNKYNNIIENQNSKKNRANRQTWKATIGVGFRWNAFDGGINAANAETLFARSRKFLATANQSKLQITQEIQSSYGAMETAKIGIQSAEQAYQSAEIAQEAARARFDVGVGDIFSVVQAINLLSTAARQKSQAILTYNNSIAQLYRYSARWPLASQKDVVLQIKSNYQPIRP